MRAAVSIGIAFELAHQCYRESHTEFRKKEERQEQILEVRKGVTCPGNREERRPVGLDLREESLELELFF